jgi:hypothetical protein
LPVRYSLKKVRELIAFAVRKSRADQRSMFLRYPPKPFKRRFTSLRQVQGVKSSVVRVGLPFDQATIF